MHGQLGEFGIVVPKAPTRLRRELPGILENAENGLPALAREDTGCPARAVPDPRSAEVGIRSRVSRNGRREQACGG